MSPTHLTADSTYEFLCLARTGGGELAGKALTEVVFVFAPVGRSFERFLARSRFAGQRQLVPRHVQPAPRQERRPVRGDEAAAHRHRGRRRAQLGAGDAVGRRGRGAGAGVALRGGHHPHHQPPPQAAPRARLAARPGRRRALLRELRAHVHPGAGDGAARLDGRVAHCRGHGAARARHLQDAAARAAAQPHALPAAAHAGPPAALRAGRREEHPRAHPAAESGGFIAKTAQVAFCHEHHMRLSWRSFQRRHFLALGQGAVDGQVQSCGHGGSRGQGLSPRGRCARGGGHGWGAGICWHWEDNGRPRRGVKYGVEHGA